MAKNKPSESPAPAAEAQDQPATETPSESPAPAAEASGKFRIYCHAPTPLAVNPFECEADSEDVAKAKFFQANGISGTDSKIDIEKTG